jgi:acyl transferase domain-containing protein
LTYKSGTQAGDAGEMSSVLDIFAPSPSAVEQGRKLDEQLFLGSAKANIGHGEAASGVSSLIKLLLMMQKDTIVPHCGIKTKVNHKFPTNFHERRVNIALNPVAWNRDVHQRKPRRAFVNNFSAAGGNTALLIEDAPALKDPAGPKDTRTRQLVAFSAKNSVSLQANLNSMLRFIEDHPNVNLGQLSYTTTARRVHHPHRIMLSISTMEQLSAQIRSAITDKKGVNRPKNAPRMIFAFTGQGALYPGMGKQFFESFSIFRTEMHRLDHLAQSHGYGSVLPVLFSTDLDFINMLPVTVHLASICIQIATFRLLASWNIAPMAVVGHSLGEYAALNVAGVLSDADTLYIVGKRATLLQEQVTRHSHAMLVAKGSVIDVANALHSLEYQTACINSPIETVLAGSNQEISNLKSVLADAHLDSIILKLPYAFHSSQMDVIMSSLRSATSSITFQKPKLPVLCPLDGGVINDIGTFDGEYLVRHCREPVNILRAFMDAQKEGIFTDQTTLLEFGPHPAISSMLKATLGSQMTVLPTASRGRDMWHTLSSTLASLYMAGADIRWGIYQRDFGASHKVLSLPSYSWDTKHYWIRYVNGWSLRKGDPPLVVANKSRLGSTTIHRVVEEACDSYKGHIVVEADITRKDMSPLVQGHEVDGIPLCTPSVYADIALTLGQYLLQRYCPSQNETQVDISDMTISKALILKAGMTHQVLQTHSEVDWSKQEALTRYMSFDVSSPCRDSAAIY